MTRAALHPHVRIVRLLALLWDEGVPLMECLGLVAHEAADAEARALLAVREDLMRGLDLSAVAGRRAPALFPPRAAPWLALGERHAELGLALSAVAELLGDNAPAREEEVRRALVGLDLVMRAGGLEAEVDAVGLALQDPAVEDALVGLSLRLQAGEALGEALAKGPVFGLAIAELVRRAEESGGLEDVLRALAREVEGRLVLEAMRAQREGRDLAPTDQLLLLFRVGALLLRVGCPYPRTLEVVAATLGRGGVAELLREALAARGGPLLSDHLPRRPDLFAPAAVVLVREFAERGGAAHRTFLRIAEAIEAGLLGPSHATRARSRG